MTSDRQHQQQPQTCERRLEGLRRALEAGGDGVRAASVRARALIVLTASPSDTPGLRLKEIVTAGSCPEWLIVMRPEPLG